MYSGRIRAAALDKLAEGHSLSDVSRETGVSRSTLRDWRESPDPRAEPTGCPRCEGSPLDHAAYAALLGYYLGDGCISRAPRFFALRVACDATWPGIIRDVEDLMRRIRPTMKVFKVTAPGVVVVQSHWKHWPCLFPQHGSGRKHERSITLMEWQRAIVEAHPAEFLRGLFHSDGSRVRNWTRRLVAGHMKQYDYPRWQFSNRSADIRELCCWALDLANVPWRQSNR